MREERGREGDRKRWEKREEEKEMRGERTKFERKEMSGREKQFQNIKINRKIMIRVWETKERREMRQKSGE